MKPEPPVTRTLAIEPSDARGGECTGRRRQRTRRIGGAELSGLRSIRRDFEVVAVFSDDPAEDRSEIELDAFLKVISDNTIRDRTTYAVTVPP
jgi:hypothetical protein